mgnify:FL=1
MGFACSYAQLENTNQNKFRQLGTQLPTPNSFRTASGAPGPNYYQQKANYKINLTLDDDKHTITGEESITYINNSSDPLRYVWVQLDQNVRAKNSDSYKIRTGKVSDKMSMSELKNFHREFDGGFKITEVTDARGKELKHTINFTMMRVELPRVIRKGEHYTFKIKWWYNINDRDKVGGRSGYEYFPKEDNSLYTIAQFYPRMAVYNDVEGWQTKQFWGRGEFALPFGDFDVKITVPSDHIIGATGVLQNPTGTLSPKQYKRFVKAKTAKAPVLIVTQEEAELAEKTKSTKTKTWHFKAKNVRDFAFASSRKFLWDAMGVKVGSKNVMAMSYYPKEGNPLWGQYSTKLVAHTIKTYSKYTINYPYPAAISVHSKSIGMEYPMICFNFGRPEKDGTYSSQTKYGMMGVIIHEVGHNFFPMIINSDERQWTWMDEGLNTFCQYLTEQEWEDNYPSRRGPAHLIVDYMKGDKSGIVPIMTHSEAIKQFGNNAYGKPATALNILRETILGRELFDYALKEYARRWAFKHPTPADFFRTMEDASGTDLDWFWRAWFYTTDHVDIALDKVEWYQPSTENPTVESEVAKWRDSQDETHIGVRRNADIEKFADSDPTVLDFYNNYDKYNVNSLDKETYTNFIESLDAEEKELLAKGGNYYNLYLSSPGGIPMPVILEFEFTDGSKEKITIPAEIWTNNHNEISKAFYFDKEVVRISLDPDLETADVERNNNYWPNNNLPNRIELFKRSKRPSRENTMQRDRRANEHTQK